jgi:hypothetical protein
LNPQPSDPKFSTARNHKEPHGKIAAKSLTNTVNPSLSFPVASSHCGNINGNSFKRVAMPFKGWSNHLFSFKFIFAVKQLFKEYPQIPNLSVADYANVLNYLPCAVSRLFPFRGAKHFILINE